MVEDKSFTIGIKFIERPTILLPAELLATLDHILRVGPPGCEVGIFIRGHWDPEALTWEMLDPADWFLPKQRVSPGFVQVLEEAPDETYNGFIHRHPPGVDSFSGHDMENVNVNIMASMVYMPGKGITDNLLNLPIQGNPLARLRFRRCIVQVQDSFDNDITNQVSEKVEGFKEEVRRVVHTERELEQGVSRLVGGLPRPERGRGVAGGSIFDRTTAGRRHAIEDSFPGNEEEDGMQSMFPTTRSHPQPARRSLRRLGSGSRMIGVGGKPAEEPTRLPPEPHHEIPLPQDDITGGLSLAEVMAQADAAEG